MFNFFQVKQHSMKRRKINMQIKSGIDIIEVERIKSSIDEIGARKKTNIKVMLQGLP